MRKLPVGMQSFERIREGDYLYVDKTKDMWEMISSGSYYFLSRPRRFGKSLLCSTLKAFFQNRRDLFKGLWIDTATDVSWAGYPVIHLEMNALNFETAEDLRASIREMLEQKIEDFGLSLGPKTSLGSLLESLVRELAATKGKVVLLIDEYDKPILEVMHDPLRADAYRSILRELYEVIKPMDTYLRFVFLTGVTKFSRTSVFSVLNNLEDMSLQPWASSICGITQVELERDFQEYFPYLSHEQGLDQKDLLEKMRSWYNGYRFSPRSLVSVYSPFSLLLFVKNAEFDDYWFNSGTPTFLINFIKYFDVELLDETNFLIDKHDLNAFDITNFNLKTLLFQAGYLTIKDFDRDNGMYTLVYPNFEVKEAMLRQLFFLLSRKETAWLKTLGASLKKALLCEDMRAVEESLQSLLMTIPYELHISREAFYQGLFFVCFKFWGFTTDIEISTAKGRIDIKIELGQKTYVLELKINKSAQEALEQARDRCYAAGFKAEGKQVWLIGINVDVSKKQLEMLAEKA